MSNYNKNVSAIIIIVCIISVIVGIFLPKDETKSRLIQTKFKKDSYLQGKPIALKSPFKGERIAVIKLEGIISDSSDNSFLRDLTSSTAVHELIVKATQDPFVKGIVIRVNSPGGTVAASQELYQAILKARKKKPVVITMGDVAASGGYYIASAADAIFANPGTLTGSIGVITSYLNFYELLTKIGVQGVVIKSGKYKDIGNPTRSLTPEEKQILQSLLDDSYNQFIKDVAKGRKMSTENIKSIAQGLIYTGKQAKKAGLVDHLGGYYKALKYAQILVKKRFPELKRKYGKRDIPVEESWKGGSLIDALFGVANKHTYPKTSFENKLFKPYTYSKYQPLWLLE